MTLESQSILEESLGKVKTFLAENKDIAQAYEISKKNISEIGFNAFTIVSDLYYRENFHSDIIKALLNPHGKHREKGKYLYLFIELLNKINPVSFINPDNYRNSKVYREKAKIDILIVDKDSKRAIIIENKINDAQDMHRQLPRYYNSIKDEYTIDAIVYITLHSSKRPETTDWNKDELEHIGKLLKIIPAYDQGKNHNLYEGWLLPSILKSDNIDSAYLLRQYADLIKSLNTNYMDTISLEKFYETLKKDDNLQTSLSIRNMLNDLPEYLAIRIEDKYKNNCDPFTKLVNWKTKCVGFSIETDKLMLVLDVYLGDFGYKVAFWSPIKDYNIRANFEDEIFNNFKYNMEINGLEKHFNLFEEDQLFNFIDSLLKSLKDKEL